MAKFLNYEERLEIEGGLKEHMSFTEIGKKLSRDRTTIAKEIRNYSVEQDTGYGNYPHNTCKYRKGCRRKKVCGINDCKHPLVVVRQIKRSHPRHVKSGGYMEIDGEPSDYHPAVRQNVWSKKLPMQIKTQAV